MTYGLRHGVEPAAAESAACDWGACFLSDNQTMGCLLNHR